MQEFQKQRPSALSQARADDADTLKVRDLTNHLLVALKNHALYPRDHAICRKSVATVQKRLDTVLADEGFLHLDVREDGFFHDGCAVHQGPAQNDYLPYQLFRDGIQWLEFHRGVTEQELSDFFWLVIRYRTPSEEAEGDLVTALWEAGFPHLRYEKEEVLWKAEPLIDFSQLKTLSGESKPAEEAQHESTAAAVRVAIPAAESAIWSLTPEEERTLRDMVRDEEQRDYTEDVLEVLTIILKEQHDPQHFAVILDFLAEELAYALAQGEFHFALKFLENLSALERSLASEAPWACALLEEFRQRIAGPDVLGVLEQAWPVVGVMDAGRLEDLRRALLWFSPDVTGMLGALLANADQPFIERFLAEVIAVHAGRDLRPVRELLNSDKESIVRKLIPVLKDLQGQESTDLLFGLTHYPSNAVCRDAVYALIARDPENLRKLFSLIDDPRPPIRSLMFEYLGRRRNLLAEELLLHYFERNMDRLRDRRHILACYRALGQCGSARSLPFLQASLLKKDWKVFLGVGDSVHRLGAALALMSMPRDKAAKALLETAAGSSFSGIRAAYQQAVEEKKHKREANR